MSLFRTRAAAALALAAALLMAAAAVANAAPVRTSLMDVESSVMCVVCGEPLAVAQSPEAFQERDVIRSLISQGDTKAQILRVLVAEYGVAVLGKPPAHGFNLTVYVLPPAVFAAGVVILIITLPRWRRRRKENISRATGPAAAADPAEEHRLDEELSRFAG